MSLVTVLKDMGGRLILDIINRFKMTLLKGESVRRTMKRYSCGVISRSKWLCWEEEEDEREERVKTKENTLGFMFNGGTLCFSYMIVDMNSFIYILLREIRRRALQMQAQSKGKHISHLHQQRQVGILALRGHTSHLLVAASRFNVDTLL